MFIKFGYLFNFPYIYIMIKNTEIQDLPENYTIKLGKDTRGFEISLNMRITKQVKEHWDRRDNARDLDLNELDWYYAISFDWDSDSIDYQYRNFDLHTEEGEKAYKEWHKEMTDYKTQPFPYLLHNNIESWFFNVFRRGYKEIFSEMYIDEDLFLKMMRAGKKANENNEHIYTNPQRRIAQKVAKYYRKRIDNVGGSEIRDGLRKANLETDRDYDCQEEYLVSVVSNARIDNLIDMIPPDMEHVGNFMNLAERKEMVKRFVETRAKKKNRESSIKAILNV